MKRYKVGEGVGDIRWNHRIRIDGTRITPLKVLAIANLRPHYLGKFDSYNDKKVKIWFS